VHAANAKHRKPNAANTTLLIAFISITFLFLPYKRTLFRNASLRALKNEDYFYSTPLRLTNYHFRTEENEVCLSK
ncbi:MAG: hypothetical protein K6E35_06950, partial [Bacteroidales bacterium]|nr:hypothetical protein [Bacteroidales bacterium]